MGDGGLEFVKLPPVWNVLDSPLRHDPVDIREGISNQRPPGNILDPCRMDLLSESIARVWAGRIRAKIRFPPFNFQGSVAGTIVKNKTLGRQTQALFHDVLRCLHHLTVHRGPCLFQDVDRLFAEDLVADLLKNLQRSPVDLTYLIL